MMSSKTDAHISWSHTGLVCVLAPDIEKNALEPRRIRALHNFGRFADNPNPQLHWYNLLMTWQALL